jgi:CHAD domain-containing protein
LATYHQLRIEFKQFRYALEFFRDLLGEEAGGLIKQVVGMQDLLGALQDAHLREGLITAFLHDQSVEGRRATQRESLSGVAEYLASAWAEQDTLLARFPVSWVAITGYDFRRSLGLAVAML